MPSTITPDAAGQLVQNGLQMERTVIAAAEELKALHLPKFDQFAEAATGMARVVRQAVQQQAEMIATLTDENRRLRLTVDRVSRSHAAADRFEEDVEQRWFGAHIRRTWHELTGR